jgi:hypothetical protein
VDKAAARWEAKSDKKMLMKEAARRYRVLYQDGRFIASEGWLRRFCSEKQFHCVVVPRFHSGYQESLRLEFPITFGRLETLERRAITLLIR